MQRRHARTALLKEFGETVTFHPKDGSGDRVVQATVNRSKLQAFGNLEGPSSAREATMFLCRDATAGVTAVVEGDEVTLEIQRGQPSVRCRVMETLDSGAAWFLVRVVA